MCKSKNLVNGAKYREGYVCMKPVGNTGLQKKRRETKKNPQMAFDVLCASVDTATFKSNAN